MVVPFICLDKKRGIMKNKRKPELLAPAGSYEAFEAALGAGADAVYVGGPDFGARAYAKNFTQEELISAIRTAHLHGKKLYLTVNTLLKNRELKERLYHSLLSCYEEGLDAVIVQDFGVLRFIRRTFPDLPVHASTQMAVTGPMGMRFLEKLGVTRVVPARELSLEELFAMHQASPIEIEAFIHGALCYSISGQCLMSSILGGRSGNRGRCAQPCRLSYRVKDENNRWVKGKNICPLSLKDICTLDLLPEILDAGVISLKIEGRMKQPEYTAGVTGMYRKYLDILEDKRENFKVSDEDRKYLLEIFSRGGSCQGYYRQQNGPSMMAFSNEKKTGNVSSGLKKRKEKIYGNLTLFAGCPAILELSYSPHGYPRKGNSGVSDKTTVRFPFPYLWEKFSLPKNGRWKNHGSAGRWKNWETRNSAGIVWTFRWTEIFLSQSELSTSSGGMPFPLWKRRYRHHTGGNSLGFLPMFQKKKSLCIRKILRNSMFPVRP